MDESKMPELTTDGPVWGAILEWEASERGREAGIAADKIDEAIASAVQAYALQCIAPLQAQIAALEADAQRSLEERIAMAVDQSRMEQEVAGVRADAGRWRALLELVCDDYKDHGPAAVISIIERVDTALNGGATPDAGRKT